ncbi:hypothetical protein BSQ38_10255 [Pediococcus damnosus]|uniref:glycerate kinase n=1 Tax=Pediococcus damnosus TaxID=51663 RepID=UPI000C1C91CC|nr:glycerate kinase [Pediococcus damnosus]PIO81992.1 hypothetical protein BSQ38_10255 [Pediococcus damnosus]
MKVIVAPDSFKNSMTAKKATESIVARLKKVDPKIKTVSLPMADGGEGTMTVLMDHFKGNRYSVEVTDAIGRPIKAELGLTEDKAKVAVIDMASASGIEHLKGAELNPFRATTFGTGQLLQASLAHRPKKIYLGVGGSATNDGGAGMAMALGFQFLNKAGKSIDLGNGGLSELETIVAPTKKVISVPLIVLNDVANPLLGPDGATNVFGTQKGASSDDKKVLEENLHHLSLVVQRDLGKDFASDWGTGGAGGLSYGLKTFFGAQLTSGIDSILKLLDFKEKVVNADYLITGEGSFDTQSRNGKVPFGLAEACLKLNPECKVIVLAGRIAPDLGELPANIKLVKSINDGQPLAKQTLDMGSENIYHLSEWLTSNYL